MMPGYPTDRVIVYNRDATFAFELTPDEQRSRLRMEEINGEHSLTVKTTRKLSEGMRLITQDDTGKIREHVVYKPDEEHSAGKCAIGTYLCMWSLQYDLMGAYAKNHAEPGMGSSCSSRDAVIAALDGQSLWTVGTCDVPAVAAGKGCVMIGVSDWERLSLVVKHWGGEIDSDIVMDDTRVVSRKINFLAHLGSSTVTRRFDWGEDLTNISRTPDPGPYYCRIVPLGRGQREYAEDDETEFDWPLDISEETPDGRVYIEDSESALVFRTKLPDGTWHYPTKVVKYDEDDPELLLNAGIADLHNHTRPGCSYEANVLQFVRAGMDAKGVQLGDNTQCIDFGFNPDAGLTVEGRVTRLEVEELAPETKTNLTIGDLAPTFAQTMQELIGRQTASISDGIKRIEGGGTIAYVQNLLEEINAQIAADGGYTYLVGGQGSITYDKAVADPTIGTEATKVTQIKGGGIRIADEKKPSFSGIEDWVWKSLIVAGHIAAELVTAVNVTAGFIGNASGGSYWDLDNNVFRIGTGAQIGETTAGEIASDAATAKSDASKALNQKVGISNLVRNGDFSNSSNHWKMINVNSYSVVNDSPRSDGKSLQVVMYSSGSLNRCICPNNRYVGSSDDNFNHEPNHTYSVSFWAKASSSNKITCCGGWYASSGATPQQRLSYVWQEDVSTTWKQFTGTLNTNLGSGSQLTGPINFILVNAGTLYITDVMIVDGEKPITSWYPDMRDVKESLENAAKVATNYLTFDSSDGLDVGYSGTSAKTRINGSGLEIFDGSGNSALSAKVQDSKSIVRVGRENSSGKVEMSSDGYVDVKYSDIVLAHFGYGSGRNESGGTSIAPYYTIGVRGSSYSSYSGIGNYSCLVGDSGVASGYASFKSGVGGAAAGNYSAAIGERCVASAEASFAANKDTIASGNSSAAFGWKTIAAASYQTVIGRYNIQSSSSSLNSYHYLLIAGKGGGSSESDRANALYLTYTGNLWIAGSLTQNSDRRLKEHHAYLGEDACDFIRALKPALYTKDGERHVGFYAQDVAEAEPEEWDTVTVTAQHTDESLDFDPLTLDYTALIAPLVAYAQLLEKRVKAQDKTIESMEARLAKLEAKLA